jgi:hypothetical protein
MLLEVPRLVLNGCQPRSLASLLDLQECSYRRLSRLAPDITGAQGTLVSRVAGSLDLYLSVVERHPYTTTIALTYRFPDSGGWVAEPNVVARLYHDARLLEAVSHSRRHPPYATRCHRRPVPTELEAKWELNRFLQRWLGYCLHQGHLFLRYTEAPALAAATAAGVSAPG